ncbi:hypothetical protein PROFUN_09665 [Planoprotostelium fungivorum]|uniref:PKD/REJ-like domain-containing protein n=1 Tax=Planoprotostelium fungivorum TaxID=1890364 RepID=A0A2P6NGK8_9EUKA|nr:hypothetical protein PROFUN_09665 [Planoprotostelium fungivorum]
MILKVSPTRGSPSKVLMRQAPRISPRLLDHGKDLAVLIKVGSSRLVAIFEEMFLLLVHACLYDGQLADCSPLNPPGLTEERGQKAHDEVDRLIAAIPLSICGVSTLSNGEIDDRTLGTDHDRAVSINGSNSTTVVLDANVNFQVNGSFFVSPTVVSNYSVVFVTGQPWSGNNGICLPTSRTNFSSNFTTPSNPGWYWITLIVNNSCVTSSTTGFLSPDDSFALICVRGDTDNDGFDDCFDVCPCLYNPSQRDSNQDMVGDDCPLFNFTFRQPALYGVNVPLQSIGTPSNMTCNTSPAFAYGWNNVVVSSTVLYGDPTQAQVSNWTVTSPLQCNSCTLKNSSTPGTFRSYSWTNGPMNRSLSYKTPQFQAILKTPYSNSGTYSDKYRNELHGISRERLVPHHIQWTMYAVMCFEWKNSQYDRTKLHMLCVYSSVDANTSSNVTYQVCVGLQCASDTMVLNIVEPRLTVTTTLNTTSLYQGQNVLVNTVIQHSNVSGADAYNVTLFQIDTSVLQVIPSTICIQIDSSACVNNVNGDYYLPLGSQLIVQYVAKINPSTPLNTPFAARNRISWYTAPNDQGGKWYCASDAVPTAPPILSVDFGRKNASAYNTLPPNISTGLQYSPSLSAGSSSYVVSTFTPNYLLGSDHTDSGIIIYQQQVNHLTAGSLYMFSFWVGEIDDVGSHDQTILTLNILDSYGNNLGTHTTAPISNNGYDSGINGAKTSYWWAFTRATFIAPNSYVTIQIVQNPYTPTSTPGNNFVIDDIQVVSILPHGTILQTSAVALDQYQALINLGVKCDGSSYIVGLYLRGYMGFSLDFSKFSSLQSLDARNCSLTSAPQLSPSVQTLDLSYNNLSAYSLMGLSLPSVTSLSLAYNMYLNSIPTWGSSLTSLDLSYTAIVDYNNVIPSSCTMKGVMLQYFPSNYRSALETQCGAKYFRVAASNVLSINGTNVVVNLAGYYGDKVTGINVTVPSGRANLISMNSSNVILSIDLSPVSYNTYFHCYSYYGANALNVGTFSHNFSSTSTVDVSSFWTSVNSLNVSNSYNTTGSAGTATLYSGFIASGSNLTFNASANIGWVWLGDAADLSNPSFSVNNAWVNISSTSTIYSLNVVNGPSGSWLPILILLVGTNQNTSFVGLSPTTLTPFCTSGISLQYKNYTTFVPKVGISPPIVLYSLIDPPTDGGIGTLVLGNVLSTSSLLSVSVNQTSSSFTIGWYNGLIRVNYTAPGGIGYLSVSINVAGKSAVYIAKYAPPTINQTTAVATIGGTTNVTGSNFGPAGAQVSATIDGVSASLIVIHSGLVLVTVPAGFNDFRRLILNVGEQMIGTLITYQSPVVTNVILPNGLMNTIGGDSFTVYGQNFGGQNLGTGSINSLTLDGVKCFCNYVAGKSFSCTTQASSGGNSSTIVLQVGNRTATYIAPSSLYKPPTITTISDLSMDGQFIINGTNLGMNVSTLEVAVNNVSVSCSYMKNHYAISCYYNSSGNSLITVTVTGQSAARSTNFKNVWAYTSNPSTTSSASFTTSNTYTAPSTSSTTSSGFSTSTTDPTSQIPATASSSPFTSTSSSTSNTPFIVTTAIQTNPFDSITSNISIPVLCSAFLVNFGLPSTLINIDDITVTFGSSSQPQYHIDSQYRLSVMFMNITSGVRYVCKYRSITIYNGTVSVIARSITVSPSSYTLLTPVSSFYWNINSNDTCTDLSMIPCDIILNDGISDHKSSLQSYGYELPNAIRVSGSFNWSFSIVCPFVSKVYANLTSISVRSLQIIQIPNITNVDLRSVYNRTASLGNVTLTDIYGNPVDFAVSVNQTMTICRMQNSTLLCNFTSTGVYSIQFTSSKDGVSLAEFKLRVYGTPDSFLPSAASIGFYRQEGNLIPITTMDSRFSKSSCQVTYTCEGLSRQVPGTLWPDATVTFDYNRPCFSLNDWTIFVDGLINLTYSFYVTSVPRVVGIYGYSPITILMDTPISRSALSLCSAYLGTFSTCSMTSSQVLIVAQSPNISSISTLHFPPNMVYDYTGLLPLAPTTINITKVVTEQYVHFNACSPIKIDSLAANGSLSCLSNRDEINYYLRQIDAVQTFTIPANLLIPGYPYRFFCPFYNDTTLYITSVYYPLPDVNITSQPHVSVLEKKKSLKLSYSTDRCSHLQYEWFARPLPSLWNDSLKNGTTLTLSGASFQPGAFVTVSLNISTSFSFAIAQYNFSVYASIPTIVLAATNFSKGYGQPIVLDASSSIDPDETGPLSFTWTCVSGSSCDSIEAATSAKTIIKSLHVDDYVFQVTVTSAVNTTASANVYVRVVADSPPEVYIAAQSKPYISAVERLVLRGYVNNTEDASRYTYSWSLLTQTWTNGTSQTPDVQLSNIVTTSTNLPSIVIAGDSLTPGSAYTFQITVRDKSQSTSDFAQVIVPVSLPPQGGNITVYPTSGDAFTTYFNISTSDWQGLPVDNPLSYSFGYLTDSGTIWLSQDSKFSYTSSLFPAGDISVILKVTNVWGASTTISRVLSVNKLVLNNAVQLITNIIKDTTASSAPVDGRNVTSAQVTSTLALINTVAQFIHSEDSNLTNSEKTDLKSVMIQTLVNVTSASNSTITPDDLASRSSSLASVVGNDTSSDSNVVILSAIRYVNKAIASTVTTSSTLVSANVSTQLLGTMSTILKSLVQKTTLKRGDGMNDGTSDIVDQAVSAVDSLHDLLLQNRICGEEAITSSSSFIHMHSAYQTPSGLSGSTFSVAGLSDISLPSQLSTNDNCLSLQVVSWTSDVNSLARGSTNHSHVTNGNLTSVDVGVIGMRISPGDFNSSREGFTFSFPLRDPSQANNYALACSYRQVYVDDWSVDETCYVVSVNSTTLTCRCHHLTEFSVFSVNTDNIGGRGNKGPSVIKEVIQFGTAGTTIVGIAVAIAVILAIVIVVVVYRYRRNKTRVIQIQAANESKAEELACDHPRERKGREDNPNVIHPYSVHERDYLCEECRDVLMNSSPSLAPSYVSSDVAQDPTLDGLEDDHHHTHTSGR